jgi:hypothetical protein
VPKGDQLQRRHILADDYCIFCGQSDRVEHLFLLCPYARAVWDHVKEQFPPQLHRKDLVNAKQWVSEFLKRKSHLSATVRHIWQTRNDIRNNESQPHHSRASSRILAYVEMILDHMFKAPKIGNGSQTSPVPWWNPPPRGIVCINVDATLFPDEATHGLGAILHDHNSQLILCARERLNYFPAPELAEARVVRRALTAAKDHGAHKAMLISHCMSLTQRIHS